jgi:hypothetical protein
MREEIPNENMMRKIKDIFGLAINVIISLRVQY